MKTEVTFSKNAQKDLNKLPRNIFDSLKSWIKSLDEIGLTQTRKISGYHDEPLRGTREGQRSVRLNRAYRVIYIVVKNDEIEIVKIIEVNKHEY